MREIGRGAREKRKKNESVCHSLRLVREGPGVVGRAGSWEPALLLTLPGKPRAHGLRSRHPPSPLPSPLSVTMRASPSQERRRGDLPAIGERRRRKSGSRGPKAEAWLPAPARGLETAVPGLRRRHVLCVPAAPCCWGALLVSAESSWGVVCDFVGRGGLLASVLPEGCALGLCD